MLELISESLGLEKDYIKKVLGEQGQHMAVNFYPPCPEPELTYGLPGHTDPNALTILLQDLEVAGLQVLKDDKWVAVNPLPNAFVINIGDRSPIYVLTLFMLCIFFKTNRYTMYFVYTLWIFFFVWFMYLCAFFIGESCEGLVLK